MHRDELNSVAFDAFLKAYEDSKEMQPREHQQALYEGVVAALSAVLSEQTLPVEPVGYVTAGELAVRRCGASCVDLFGKVVPKGHEMVPLYAHPHRSALVDNSHASEAVVEVLREALVQAEKEIVELYKVIAPHGDFAAQSVAVTSIRAALSSLRPPEVGSATLSSVTGGGE